MSDKKQKEKLAKDVLGALNRYANEISIEKLEQRKISEILLLPYSHHDHAYMCTRNWHKRRYAQIFCEVLDIMKEDPDYTWNIDNIEHSWEPFVCYCPDRVEEFKKRVQEGRICIFNGGFALLRPSENYEETYIRNMIYGRKWFQEAFDLEEIPGVYNAYTGCGHSQLPQIFYHHTRECREHWKRCF